MARHPKQFLVLDQGGHASRALVIDAGGRIHGEQHLPIEASRLSESRVEYDGPAIVRSLRQAASQLLSSTPNGLEITAAGIATQRSNVACWDRQSGAALSPVLSWQDRRAGDLVKQWLPYGDDVHRQTGLHLSPHYGASKLRWCLDHLADVETALARGSLVAGPMASYLTYQLLEERPCVTDPVNASRTLLWSIDHHDWADALLDRFRIPRRILPRCVPSTFPYGTLALAGRRIPMTLVTGDQSAALFALGEPEPLTAYITVGTGAFIQCYTGQELVISDTLLSSISCIDKAGPAYCLEGTVNGAGSALAHACDELGLKNIESRLPGWLESVRNPPLYLNGISGLGTPYLGVSMESRYIGQGDSEARIVAVIESIIFLIQQNLLEMKRQLHKLTGIVIGGGLSRLDAFCQRLADLSDCPVRRSTETETTCLGLAYLLAGRPSDWPLLNQVQTFLPRDNAELAERYRQWCAALENSLP